MSPPSTYKILENSNNFLLNSVYSFEEIPYLTRSLHPATQSIAETRQPAAMLQTTFCRPLTTLLDSSQHQQAVCWVVCSGSPCFWYLALRKHEEPLSSTVTTRPLGIHPLTPYFSTPTGGVSEMYDQAVPVSSTWDCGSMKNHYPRRPPSALEIHPFDTIFLNTNRRCVGFYDQGIHVSSTWDRDCTE
ncbi:hypothetical protein AAEP93_009505 [Penicillium crustosum]